MPKFASLTLVGWLLGAIHPALAQLSVTKNSATDWVMSNGAVTVDWDSNQGNIWKVVLAGTTDDLIDATQTAGDGTPKGFYMDNTGIGAGTVTTGIDLSQGRYLDWWITTASNSTNAFTYSEHFVLYPNDPGIHAYIVFNHSPTDIPGSLGQVQYVFRVSQPLFTHTYSYNSGLNNLGATLIPLPDPTVTGNTDPGRQVQDATVDLHGLAVPPGYTRNFYTKYDYSSFEYLHQLHGIYGSTYGCWGIFARTDSQVGGPVKQDLIFTGNICIGELLSDHLAYNVGYTPPQGVNRTRIFGPLYFRLNTGTPSTMFADAMGSMNQALLDWDADNTLLAAGYVPSAGRGTVAPTISGGGSNTPNTAWAVLADNHANFQFSSLGNQYWTANNSSGTAPLTTVVPGTYRLSSYTLGQWGESRVDNVSVAAGTTTPVSMAFTPENFGPLPPIWTIGTPTRSADKFLHGTDPVTGQDDREYPGAWNYWGDFASTNGAAVYYATAVGAQAATNNLRAWNYVQWNVFDPGLFGGVFNAADDTTDGYKYVCPAYAGNPASARCPAWQVYFTATSPQLNQGPYTVLSVGFASTDGNVTATLNGHSLTWNGLSTLKTSDAATRSGLQGTYQWVVFQWPTSDLNAAGASNEITLSTSGNVEYDALRMEIANLSAAPSVRGWTDYEFVTSGSYVPANDTVANPTVPIVTAPPAAVAVASGSTAVFNVAAALASSYQWSFNNAPIPGATNARYVVPGATAANAGAYACIVSNAAGSAASAAAVLTVSSGASPSRLVNLSVNTTAGKSRVLTTGFVSGGAGTSGAQNLLIRAVGPALTALGISGVLANPTLTVFNGSAPVGANDNWGMPAANLAAVTGAEAATFAFPLASSGSLDAALAIPLPVGAYTVQVSGNTTASGTVLAEIYDNTPAGATTPAAPRLINVSANSQIGANGSLTVGLVVGGATAETVLLRASGPALAALGVPGTLLNPQLALHATVNHQDTVLASNAGWGGDPQITAADAAVGAFPLTNPASTDSVILATLAPGAYTVVASSATGAAGVVLVEVYELP